MNVPPTECFDKVLCADEDIDTRKKLYNWWRSVFEVLSRCKNNIPKDRKSEYDGKVDDLMAEILKAGDSASSDDNEVVLESDDLGYEQASKEDEKKMLDDMKFAISKIGEIANKVQELINFVNPYCDGGDVVVENRVFDDLDGFRSEYLLGNISDEEMENEIRTSDMNPSMVDGVIKSLKELKDEFLGLVESVNNGSSSTTSLRSFVSRLHMTTVFGFDKWWDNCPLNKDNNMKYNKINESVTNGDIYRATNVVRRKFVLGIYNNKRALSSLRQACHDDDVAMKKFRNWQSDRDDFDDCVADAIDIGNGKSVVDYMMKNDLADSEDEATQFVSEYLDLPVGGGDDYEKDDWLMSVKKDYLDGKITQDEVADKMIDMKYDSDYIMDCLGKWDSEKGSGSRMDEGSDWVSVDSLIGKDVVEEGTSEFKVGDKVIWCAPDGISSSGWTIVDIQNEDSDNVVYCIEQEDGSYAEVLEDEIMIDKGEIMNERSIGPLEVAARKYYKKIGEALGVLKNFQKETLDHAPTCEYEIDQAIKNLNTVYEWCEVGVTEGFDGVDDDDNMFDE